MSIFGSTGELWRITAPAVKYVGTFCGESCVNSFAVNKLIVIQFSGENFSAVIRRELIG